MPSCSVWSRKSLRRSILFPFPNDGAHSALGDFQHCRNCFYPSPDLFLLTILSQFSGQLLGLHGGVSALTCTVNCGTFYRKVCFFLTQVQSIQLATGGLQSSCGNISRMIKGNWMHLNSIWSVTAKGPSIGTILCALLVLPKQSPGLLDTILDGSPLQRRLLEWLNHPSKLVLILPTLEG